MISQLRFPMVNSPAPQRPVIDDGGKPISKIKIGLGAAAILALVGLFWGLPETELLATLTDEQALREWVDRLGFWGPLATVALMAGAVVMSPIPSAPIAIMAGAAYGPLRGTVYVVLGAEAGALIAFWIARYLGYEVVQRWRRIRPLLRRLDQSRSQTWLMTIVFASRLVPFISFDAVSYAAGLTPLTFWRFAVATLSGIIPVSYLLTYFGEELLTFESMHTTTLLILFSGITLIPIAAEILWRRYRKGKR